MSTRLAAKSGRLCIGLLIAATCLPALRTKSDEPAKAEKPASDWMLGKEAGDVRDDNGLKMKLVWCPPGVFEMENIQRVTRKVIEEVAGKAPVEREVTEQTSSPVKVILTSGYWLGRYEVTQAEWKQVMVTEPWKIEPKTKEGDDLPATWVTWEIASTFCRELTHRERTAGRLAEGWEYALPTEAQWERACRAGTATRFSFGDDEGNIGEYAWFAGNARAGEHFVHGVGQKKPNPWGLHDMHGNVEEWCRDNYGPQLPGGRDPVVTRAFNFFVFRGGHGISQHAQCRSSARTPGHKSESSSALGFRVALTPVRPAR